MSFLERIGREDLLLGAVLTALLLFFWPTVSSFPSVWMQPYREHGFVVAVLVLWLLWHERHALLLSQESWLLGAPLLALLSLTWLVALAANVGVLHQILFTGVLAGWALVTFGSPALSLVLAGTLTFSLALPIWGFIVPVLQRATAIMSGMISRIAGVSPIIEGDTITIASGTFLVESGCSGINYVLAGLTLGASYAHLSTTRWQVKLQIVAIAGVTAVVANWIRVGVLVVLGDRLGIMSPWVTDHLWQGWAIFTLLMVPAYLVMRWVERREGAASHSPDPSEVRSPDHGMPRPSWTRRALLAAATAVVGPLLYVGIGVLPAKEIDPGPQPLTLSEAWSPVPRSSAEARWTPAFQGIDQSLLWFVLVDGGAVDGGRYLFQDQRPGEELVQWSNVIAPDSLLVSTRLIGPLARDRRYVREAVVWHDGTLRLAWYWYRVAGVDTPFETNAKLLEVVSFFRRAPASELIVLSAECDLDSCSGAAARLLKAIAGPEGA